jgi:TPR repeat protein
MWRHLLFSTALVAAATRGVSGQTATGDGVAALARGDYQHAAEILKPIAEDWRSNDPAAQFFMAGLYETGRGVDPDPLRACALFARASDKYDNPFGHPRRRGAVASEKAHLVGRLRKRYRELFRQEFAETVADAREVESELHDLVAALTRR